MSDFSIFVTKNLQEVVFHPAFKINNDIDGIINFSISVVLKKKTVFLKTTKIEKVNGSVNTIGHFKVFFNREFIERGIIVLK